MAVISPPLYLAAGSHSAELDRRAHAAFTSYTEGVVSGGDLAVSQRAGTTNMSVDVASGSAFIKGDEATYQGTYFFENQGVLNLPIAAAHASLSRRDLVVARVQDASYSGVNNLATLEVVTGTAAGSPVDPATPVNALPLARVTVGPGVTAIANASITDLRGRVKFPGGVPSGLESARPTTPSIGDMYYATDTGRLWFAWSTSNSWFLVAHYQTSAVGCLINRVAAMTLGGSGSITKIPWDNEVADSLGFHVAGSTDVVVPSGYGGIYHVRFHYQGTAGLNGQLAIQLDNISQVRVGYMDPMQTLDWTGPVNAGQIITAAVYNGGTSNAAVINNSPDSIAPRVPHLAVWKVG